MFAKISFQNLTSWDVMYRRISRPARQHVDAYTYKYRDLKVILFKVYAHIYSDNFNKYDSKYPKYLADGTQTEPIFKASNKKPSHRYISTESSFSDLLIHACR